MDKFKLSSVLLFALVIPFIMTYRIGPGDTPYWLFGLIFLMLISNIVLDIFRLSQNKYFLFKDILLWFLIVTVIGSAFVSAIIVRHKTHPVYGIHDIVLQQEAAIRFFLDGKNPYATSYFGTFLEQWHYSDTEKNPALYHFVMQPFYLLFSLPFYFLSNHTIGYFDGRIPLLFLFVVMLIVAYKLVRNNEKKLLLVTLLAFNPAILGYTLEGRSDIFMFSFMFIALYLFYIRKYSFAGIMMALAFAVKQSAWPILPFYISFLYFQKKNVFGTVKALLPFFITFIAIVAPFYFWNAKAFTDSTINYLSGATTYSYPISGYGFGKLLQEMGVIKDVKAYYPFTIWQALISLPLLVILFMYLKRELNVRNLIFAYGIFLFVYWYFSRYFNNSHLAYLSMVFITAYFWPEEKTI